MYVSLCSVLHPSKGGAINFAYADWNAKILSLLNRRCLTCWLGPHCLVYREIRASVCPPVTQPEAQRELCFWAHGGDGAENVGTVIALFTFGCGIAVVQFI